MKLIVAAATLVATGAVSALVVVPATAHTTGIHDNCTNLNQKWPHGMGRKNAHDSTSGDPVTNFKRSAKAYRAAESHNGTLDADDDGIACEKH